MFEENNSLHFNKEVAQIIAYVLFWIAVLYLVVFTATEGKAVKNGFKGKDKTWQFIEAAGFLWLIVFITTALLDLIGFHASTNLWASLDAIFLIAAGAKGYIDMNTKKYSKDESIK